jgi:hypothetical protein
MNDAPQGPPPSVPSLVGQMVHDFAQKALTAASVSLVTHGLMTSDQATAFVQDGTGLVLLAVSVGWTVLANRLRQQKFTALRNAPPSPSTQQP